MISGGGKADLKLKKNHHSSSGDASRVSCRDVIFGSGRGIQAGEERLRRVAQPTEWTTSHAFSLPLFRFICGRSDSGDVVSGGRRCVCVRRVKLRVVHIEPVNGLSSHISTQARLNETRVEFTHCSVFWLKLAHVSGHCGPETCPFLMESRSCD